MNEYNQLERINGYLDNIRRRTDKNGIKYQDLVALNRCLTAKEFLLNNRQKQLEKEGRELCNRQTIITFQLSSKTQPTN